jgi:sialate O-acetylesterase
VKGFQIAGADRQWHWAEAKLGPNGTVVVWSDEVKEPVAVRYAWSSNPVDEPVQRSRPAGRPVPDRRLAGGDGPEAGGAK